MIRRTPTPPRVSQAPESSRQVLREILAPLVEQRTGDLPMLPAAAIEVLRIVKDPRFHVDKVLHLVERDPPLAARILGVANSGFYSRGTPVRSLRQAIVRLGMHALKDVVYMAVYATTVFDSPALVDLVRETFEHSVVTARFCRSLAEQVGLDSDTAFLGGLLHDVGRARCYKQIARCAPQVASKRDRVEEAVDEFHERAGAVLARAWQLPAEVVDACAHHHNPGERPYAKLAWAADALGYAARGLMPIEEAHARLEALGFDLASREAFIEESLNEVAMESANQEGPETIPPQFSQRPNGTSQRPHGVSQRPARSKPPAQ